MRVRNDKVTKKTITIDLIVGMIFKICKYIDASTSRRKDLITKKFQSKN